MAFAFYDQMVVFDNVTKAIVVVAMARLDKPGVTPAAAYQAACRRVDSSGGAAFVAALRSPTFRHSYGRRRQACIPLELHAGRVRSGGPQVRRIHPRRRHLSGRAESAAGSAAADPSLRDLSHAARGESQPVHVLRPHAERHAGRQFAGDDGARGRRAGHGPPAGRHAPPRRDRRGRPPPGRGTAGRSQGAGRAHDAGRPGPQRRGPGGPLRLRASSAT